MTTNWKVLHIRLIPKSNEVCDPSRAREETRNRAAASPVKSELVRPALALPAPSKIPASVPLSAMLQIGKLIQPKVDAVTLQFEQFDLKAREWLAATIRSESLSEQGEVCQRGISRCLGSHSHIRWIAASREVCGQEI